jgi:putative ABC transport system permease protein
MLLKLIWRNIWRNKRRTVITSASILFAVLLAILMESIQKGAWNNMIGNVVNSYYGYAQVHQNGFWEDQTIERAIPWNEAFRDKIAGTPQIKAVLPRLENFALASSGNLSMGVLVIGMDPKPENDMTKLAGRISAGTYLQADDHAVLLADGIAKQLRLSVGDTLILVSQGYHGVNAAGKFPIKGLLHFPSPDLNKRMVYLPLASAQWLFSAPDLITSTALWIEREKDIAPALRVLSQKLDAEAYEIMDWKALMPDILQAKALDSAGNIMVYFVLYLVIAFGIFGTILMMTQERRYEFGVLTAIGMQKSLLAFLVWMETVFLGLTGALAGIIVAFPIVSYFKTNPIKFTGEMASMMETYGFEPVFPAVLDWRIFAVQTLIVFMITAVLALFPVMKIKKLNPVSAMRV